MTTALKTSNRLIRLAALFAAILFFAPIALGQNLLSPRPLGGSSAQRLAPPPQRAVPVKRKSAPPAAAVPVWVEQGARRSQAVAPAKKAEKRKAAVKRKARKKARSKKRSRRNARNKARGRGTGGWRVRTDSIPTLQPDTFYATAKASERYAAIADAGGWPKIARPIRRGASGPAVEVLRKRLALEGELPATASTGTVWDEQLTDAVRNYQYRVGLRQNGSVDARTRKALNIPAALRFKQLASSAHRIAGSKFAFGSRYVVVNIPSASVEAVENGRVVRRYVAVVGDVKHRSPEVITRITHINLNPTWTVPVSIIKNEIIPKLRRDPGYLSRSRMKILDRRGKEIDPSTINWKTKKSVNFTLRQDSGRRNALGTLRINMPNNQAVYMHDTPSKRFFRRNYRFLSHGCVRVKNVYDLAVWLLRDTPGRWNKKAINRQVNRGKRRDVRLSSAVPVAWIYMTGWASSDGVVHFRDDIYKVDRIGGKRAARR